MFWKIKILKLRLSDIVSDCGIEKDDGSDAELILKRIFVVKISFRLG